MYLLVRALTGDRAAATIAGAIFALYPFRYEHYSHLELQMTMWMPLALHALHRTLSRERLRDGLLMGVAVALQTLSCLYYGVFFSVVSAAAHGRALDGASIGVARRSRACRRRGAGRRAGAAGRHGLRRQQACRRRARGKIVEYHSAVPEDYLDARRGAGCTRI